MADIVSLGFKVDTSQIEKGYKRLGKMGDQAEKSERKIDKMTKGAKAAGTAIAGMATAASASVVAITALMNHLANVERELQASARMAGLTTDQFEAMGFAYRQFGLTVEQVNDIYKDSREKVGQWLTDQTGGLEDFGNAMGMNKDELTKFAKEIDGLTGQQLLQRMVDEMQAAGVSASQMSFALEGMASEATRMIPALENNGQAINSLSNEYVKFNAAFSLNDDDVQNYADLAKNFDLFLDTAQNGITKTLSPLAEVMAVLAAEATEFVAALASGSIAAAQKDYSEALAEQLEARRLLGEAQNIPAAFGQDVIDQETRIAQERLDAANKAVEAADQQLEAAKKTAQAQLEVKRSSTRNVNVNITGGLTGTGSAGAATFGDIFGGTNTVDMFALNQAKEYTQWAESISTTSTQIAALRAEIEKTQNAVAEGDVSAQVGEEYIADLRAQIDELNVNPFESMTTGAQDALSAMSGMFESGSKDAKKLAIAMEALNLVQAIGAVLNQGNGDPYTAFGRMAAMAAMVASLGMSVGNLGGDFQDDSQFNQENQNLNSWGEHAESIADATDVTASATEKLVGINTDMLDALKGLNLSIMSASGIVARGTTIPQINQSKLTIDADDIMGILDPLGAFDILFDPLGLLGGITKSVLGFLGGKSKVTDEGIRIIGGSINDLIDEVLVQGFQKVKYKKWALGSSKSKTVFQTLDEEVGQQVSLIFESLVNTVATGANVLGLSQKEIQDAIEGFEVATHSISLKGLSAERQQEVINNYFSSVFNDLAGTVVPFLSEFQMVGEELGATLSRLATEVNVAEYLVDNFGLTFGDKMADPQAFVQAADNLANLAGGVEELADQVSGFTNAFATDAQKFQIYQDALTSALGEVGLSLPSTAEGMFELISSLDGTTEAGQEQIATLLGLTDTASAYFKLLDKTAGAYREAAEGLFDITEASRAMSLQSALAAARMGDFSLAEQLDLGGIAPSTRDFNTALEYNLARAETAARLNELADLQAGQVTVEDKQLTVLEQIRDKLGDGGTMDGDVKSELMALRNQMNKQQTETNDYLRRMAYQGAE
ncbi:putative tail tape measure protein [Vibrio phage vB_VaS_L1]|nr:putative tail tape measure protein [Vibrio phage vB_VaS_L1]